MFRWKLTLLYFFTIVLVVASMWVLIEEQKDAHRRELIAPGLKAAATSYEVSLHARYADLKSYSRNLLQSDLPTYLELLKEQRDSVRSVGMAIRQEFPGRRVAPEHILRFVDKEAKEILDRFENSIAEQIKAPWDVKGGYARYMRDIYSSCLSESEPWPVCYFKMTYVPLSRVIFPEQKKVLGGDFPELFILVDPDGKTTRLLFDNLDKSLDSMMTEDIFRAATGYSHHIKKDFQLTAGVLEQVRDSFEPMISSYLVLPENRVFAIVASRVEGKSGDFLGALIVGYQLDRMLATEDTFGVLGVRPVLERCLDITVDEDAAPASEKRCEYEMARQDKGITFLYRDKNPEPIVLGSTLGAERLNQLVRFMNKNAFQTKVTSEGFVGLAVSFPADFVPEGQSLSAVLSVDLENALSIFTTLKMVLVVAGIIVFLMGLMLIYLLVRAQAKPFEQIDAGIHEIIGGDFEYQFPFDFSDELPRSMAQSLTIMKAVLLGQPLPEDQERDDSWAANIQVVGDFDGPATEVPEGSSEATEIAEDTDDLPAEIEEINAKDITESATEYYRRLFREYVEARQALGEETGSITYIKFVEKIAKTEKSLREKFGTRQVLFKVVQKDKRVVLLPIKVVD